MKVTEDLKEAIKHAPLAEVLTLKASVLNAINSANAAKKFSYTTLMMAALASIACSFALAYPAWDNLVYGIFFSALLATQSVIIIPNNLYRIYEIDETLKYHLKILSCIILREEEEAENAK